MMMATNTQGDSPFQHDYPFDPSYGYDLQDLLAVKPPPEPKDLPRFGNSAIARHSQSTPLHGLRAVAIDMLTITAWTSNTVPPTDFRSAAGC